MTAKRCLEMVVYDPAAAAEQRGNAKRARPSMTDAGAVVPYNAAAQPDDVEPINPVPLNAVAPQRPPAPAPAPLIREEPTCLRQHILPALQLRADLPVHFIDDKRVTSTDLDPHQNRFRIRTDGVLLRLRPILIVEELSSANLLDDPAPRTRRKPTEKGGTAAAEGEQGEKGKRKKKQGRAHGGLPVKLVDLAAGASWELQLSRWDSSHGTIVKGEGYMDFIRRCSFRENDAVEIWAFKQPAFRLFGSIVHNGSPLHLLIVKRDDKHAMCRYCPLQHQ